jgi:hypothetical protein
MVGVHVRINEKSNWLIGQRPYGIDNPIRKYCELVIDQKYTIITDKQADIATPALDVIDLSGHRMRFDLNRIKVLSHYDVAAEDRCRQSDKRQRF